MTHQDEPTWYDDQECRACRDTERCEFHAQLEAANADREACDHGAYYNDGREVTCGRCGEVVAVWVMPEWMR